MTGRTGSKTPLAKATASKSAPTSKGTKSSAKNTNSKETKLPALSPKDSTKALADPLNGPRKPSDCSLPSTTPRSPTKPVAEQVRLPSPNETRPMTPLLDKPVAEKALVEANKQAEEIHALPTETNIDTPVINPSNDPSTTDEKKATEAAIDIQEEDCGNGTVQLIYEQYDEMFPIVDGSTTQSEIDEVYCLSFVMPNCRVRLSYHSNVERLQRESEGDFDSLVLEDPPGVYHNLTNGTTYYVVVEQEEAQLLRDQAKTKELWASEVEKDKVERNDGRGFESCSCIYGNPCVDEYGCKDWDKRYAVAQANGWKGF